MLCVLCLIVLWGFSLVTSYSGVKDLHYIIYRRGGSARILHASPNGTQEVSKYSTHSVNSHAIDLGASDAV